MSNFITRYEAARAEEDVERIIRSSPASERADSTALIINHLLGASLCALQARDSIEHAQTVGDLKREVSGGFFGLADLLLDLAFLLEREPCQPTSTPS